MKSSSVKRFSLVSVVAVALVAFGLTAVGTAADPIKIGAFFDLSGPAASIGTPTKLVAQMVVDKINKDGGINGRPLELVFGDTGGDPTKALMVAKRFVEQDKVSAIIGPTRTGTGMAAKAFLEKAEIPTVMTVGGDPVVMGGKFGPYRWTFKTPQRTADAVRVIYAYLKAHGTTKIALFTATDGFGKFGLDWLKQLAPEYGIEIVASESFAETDTDMTAQLAKIKEAQAQALVCWTIGPAGARVAKNVKQLAMTMPLIQCHGLPDPTYIDLAGSASEGNLMPSTKLMVADQLPDSDPQKAVIQDFTHLYKDVYHFDKQYPINTHSGYAWDALYLLANAMRQAGTEPEAVRGALENIKGYVGISGIYNLTAEDHNGLGPDSLVMVMIKDGKWVLAK